MPNSKSRNKNDTKVDVVDSGAESIFLPFQVSELVRVWLHAFLYGERTSSYARVPPIEKQGDDENFDKQASRSASRNSDFKQMNFFYGHSD